MAATQSLQFPLSPPTSPPSLSVYPVRPIPPHLPSSETTSTNSNSVSKDTLITLSPGPRISTRDRRQSGASNHSSSTNDSRRNSNQFVTARYPSPAPSSPASSPTHAQGQFSSPMTSMGGLSGQGSFRRDGSSSSALMLQGIEAQLQIPPYRGPPASNTRSGREDQNLDPASAQQRQQSSVQGLAYSNHGGRMDEVKGTMGPPMQRIPSAQQTQHRPVSSTIVPLHMAPSLYPSPQFLYPQSTDMQAPLSQSTRIPSSMSGSGSAYAPREQIALNTPAGSSSAVTAVNPASVSTAANPASRNRASHQIIPISASSAAAHAAQNVSIALHTAQYSNSSRPKVFFGNYQLLHTLGEGEFGKVKLGVHAQTWGEEVAIKLIKKGSIENAARHMKVQREIDVLKVVRHPHIVRLHEVHETDKYIGIVLEYASGGELFEYILAHKHLREQMACKLFAQLISGVGYLHAKKIVHRDLKLENLLLDRNRNIVITDFGFANRFNESGNDLMATSCGSPCYAAPELVLHEGHYMGSAVDVWSCGVILYAMLSGYLPYDDDPANPDGDNINLLYRYISNTKLSFPDWISPEPRELLLMMLVPDPIKRCSLRDVMRHSWLRRYSNFFQSSVEELEEQADLAYEDKKVLLQQQQAEYFRQTGQSPPAHMARSMSTPGVLLNSTAQARHRSALVTSTTMALTPEMGPPQARLPSQIPAPVANLSSSATSPRRAHVQSAILTPMYNNQFTDPFASASNNRVHGHIPVSSSAYTTMPVIESSSYVSSSSAAMGPSLSAPGEVEAISDSLTSEGEIRGEPRSRKTDDDDASTTSSARAARNAARPVSAMPSTTSSNSEAKKRKGDEKRYTVQLEYTSPQQPPSESTRSRTKQRESLSGNEDRPDVFIPPPPHPALMQASRPDQPVFVSPADSTLPIIEAAAAAESMDVYMQSPNVSPAHSVKDREKEKDGGEMMVESLVAIPTVSPVREVAEQPLESVSAKSVLAVTSSAAAGAKRTPPASPRQTSLVNRTPKRSTTDSENITQSPQGTNPKGSATTTSATSPKASIVPFPSPNKQERRSPALPSPVERPSTAASSKSARHKKGVSTERAFFSRFLGSSTTSVNTTDVRGDLSRSRTSSTANALPALSQQQQLQSDIKESLSTASALDDLANGGGRNRRRKALSLVVDPFSRSTSNSNNASAAAAAKNRRSARVQTLSSSTTAGSMTRLSESQEAAARTRSESVMTQSTQRSVNPPSSTIASPSLSTVNVNGSRQSVVLPLVSNPSSGPAPSHIPQPVYGLHSNNTTQEASKSKRVSDWFRWKSVARDSVQINPVVAPSPIKTDFDKRQSRQAVPQQQQQQAPQTVVIPSAHRQSNTSQVQAQIRPESRGQPTVVVTAEAASPPPQAHGSVAQQQQQQQQKQTKERVVATPADARQFAAEQARQPLAASRSLRSRTNASEASSTSFDETKLKIHAGATDRRVVTKSPPPVIMEEVRKVLYGMGMEIIKDSDYRLECTRRSRKQVAAMIAAGTFPATTPSLGLSPSPSSTFRSFFAGRKNSSTRTSLTGHSPAMPSPSLSVSTMTMTIENSPESVGLSPTLSDQSQLQPLPYFGANPNLDSGGEVRFSVEIVRVKGLKGLYALDLRRMKGSLHDYKENHETFVDRLNLGSAT